MAIGDRIELEAGAARHLTSALRMTSGQLITLFNGQGGEYVAELVEAKRQLQYVSLTLISWSRSSLSIHLAIVFLVVTHGWIMQKPW